MCSLLTKNTNFFQALKNLLKNSKLLLGKQNYEAGL